MAQRSIRFPDELHDAIDAEAERRGKPHTFSSVLLEWAARGRDPAPAASSERVVAARSERALAAASGNGSSGAAASEQGPVPPRAPARQKVKQEAAPSSAGTPLPKIARKHWA